LNRSSAAYARKNGHVIASKERITLSEPASLASFFASVSSVLGLPPSIARILPSGTFSPSFGCLGW